MLHSWVGKFWSGAFTAIISTITGAYFFGEMLYPQKFADIQFLIICIVFLFQSLMLAFLTSYISTKVTKEIRFKRELQKNKKELEKFIEVQNQFISVMNHDIKTPLMTISGYLEIIGKNIQKEDYSEIQKYINITKRQSDRLNKLVTDLVDFSRISKNGLNLHLEVIEVNSFLSEIVERYSYHNSRNKIILKSDSKKILLTVDKYRFNQAISSLIDNSLKFSKEDSDILIEIISEVKNIGFVITDNGDKFPKEEINNIFGEIYNSELKSARTHKSWGIALYIAGRIINKHGGKITIKSDNNKKNSFYFSIPKNFK